MHGPNRLPEARARGPLMRFLAQFHNVLIYVLLGAAVVTAGLQHWVDTGVILAVVLANAVIGFIQEGKAEAAMAAIRGMLAPRAAVLRDGRAGHGRRGRTRARRHRAAGGGRQGARRPAGSRSAGACRPGGDPDGRIRAGRKGHRAGRADAPLGDRRPMLWSGTLVTQGTARGLVVATGTTTEIGRIGGLLAGVEQLTTPLVAQIDYFARWLSFLILLASGLLLAYGYFVGHHEFSEMFMAVVGVAVAAIPEGLPAVMTITLAIGVQAMARRNAIVRRLPAIEAIGSVSVICTDKTGTLTRNEMMVAAVETAEGAFTIAGEGYAPEGAVTPAGRSRPPRPGGGLCNDAALALPRRGNGRSRATRWRARFWPSPGKAGGDHRARRLDAIPFDSRHRFMAVLTEGPEGRLTHVKGAPERVLRMCGGIDLHHWHERADALARRGLRVLALAERAEDGRTDRRRLRWRAA